MQVAKPLDGVNVLVTRPAHQSSYLANGIRSLGGNPILFPVLEVTDIVDTAPLLKLIDRLEQFDLAVFVSPNAVHKAMNLIQSRRPMPSNLAIAVVGESSKDALNQYGVHDVIVPTERFDSETLLEHVVLQDMAGKNVVIFRGNDGRKLLKETLTKRGAHVEYAQCYHRGKPDIDATFFINQCRNNHRNALTITSSEGLHNLFDMIGQSGRDLLLVTPLFTAHERIAQLAEQLGIKHVITSKKSGDNGLLDSLLNYFQTTNYQE